MSDSGLDDTAMTSSSASDVNRVLRLNGAKTNSRYFGFPWKQRNSNETKSSRNLEFNDVGPENLSNSKISNGFLKNIKKRLRLKNLTLCKAKQKIIAVDTPCNGDNDDAPESQSEGKSLSFVDERNPTETKDRVKIVDLDFSLCEKVDEITSSPEADACWDSYSTLENRRDNEHDAPLRDNSNEIDIRLGIKNNDKDENNLPNLPENAASLAVLGGKVAEPQSKSAKETIEANENAIEEQLSNKSKAKVNLSEELLKLSKYGWYWGPISGDEADSKLVSEPDGAFLVRDSSDDRYLLTLSFKSSGRLLHARMEHSGGLFSLCNQGENNKGYTSVAALIDHSMNSSQSAIFCYSRPKYPGYPSFPVRLTKPVSRFTQVRSLQYLCRFVIRQNTRLDNIHKLPLPKTIRGYIEEAHY